MGDPYRGRRKPRDSRVSGRTGNYTLPNLRDFRNGQPILLWHGAALRLGATVRSQVADFSLAFRRNRTIAPRDHRAFNP